MTELITLAGEINDHHQAFEKAAQNALQHARAAGLALQQAKAQCEHGQWLCWVDEHCDCSRRSAQRYMRVAENWSAIESNASRVSHLPLTVALRELATPRPAAAGQHSIQIPCSQALDADLPERRPITVPTRAPSRTRSPTYAETHIELVDSEAVAMLRQWVERFEPLRPYNPELFEAADRFVSGRNSESPQGKEHR